MSVERKQGLTEKQLSILESEMALCKKGHGARLHVVAHR